MLQEKITRRDFMKVMGVIAGTTFVAPAFPVSETPVDTSGQAEFLEAIAESHDWEPVKGLTREFWIEVNGVPCYDVLGVQLTQGNIEATFSYDPSSPVATMGHNEQVIALVCGDERVTGKGWMVRHSLESIFDDELVVTCEWRGSSPYTAS